MRRPVKEARRKAAERRGQIEAAAKAFKDLRPAREVMTLVRAVPTCFVQFDHATRVGGLPIERFMLLHGPSNHGKTTFALGLMRSFLARDHFALFVDAERTTPFDWAQKLIGPEIAEHPGFFADRPETYEGTIGKVREFLNTIARLKKDGEIEQETAAIVVVDSLRKLVPKDLMKEILAERKGEVTGGKDRSAQLKARMNAAWMDELVPLLEHAGAGFVAIAREMEDPDADVWARKFKTNYKVGGGSAIYYDASLVMRVNRAEWVTNGKQGKERQVWGERHRVTIKKTKIAGKDDKEVVSYFHVSNGVKNAEGFDPARDVLELADRFGVVERGKGTTLLFDGQLIGKSEEQAAATLRGNEEMLAEVERRVRAEFGTHAPDEPGEEEQEDA